MLCKEISQQHNALLYVLLQYLKTQISTFKIWLNWQTTVELYSIQYPDSVTLYAIKNIKLFEIS